MKILITGSAGGAGQAAVEYALMHGAMVSAVSRSNIVLSRQASMGASTYIADLLTLSDEFLLREIHDQDVIWHCAGLVAPHALPMEYEESNVKLAARMYQAAARMKVPLFIHVSSPALYFDFKNRQGITEDFRAKKPASAYAASKAKAEDILIALAQKNPSTKLIILRPRLLYGVHDRVFLPQVLRMLDRRDGKIRLPNAGHAILDFCAQDNLAHALWCASLNSSKVPSGSVFNITDGSPVSIQEFLTVVAAPAGHTLVVKSIPYSILSMAALFSEKWAEWFGGDPKLSRHVIGGLNYHCTLDISAAQRQLGYKPLYNTLDGVHFAMQRRLQR